MNCSVTPVAYSKENNMTLLPRMTKKQQLKTLLASMLFAASLPVMAMNLQ